MATKRMKRFTDAAQPNPRSADAVRIDLGKSVNAVLTPDAAVEIAEYLLERVRLLWEYDESGEINIKLWNVKPSKNLRVGFDG